MSTIIRDSRNEQECQIRDICVGDTFMINDNLYLLIDLDTGDKQTVYCAGLGNGAYHQFGMSQVITRVSIEINIMTYRKGD